MLHAIRQVVMIVMMVIIRDAVGSPVQGLGLGLLSEMEHWRGHR